MTGVRDTGAGPRTTLSGPFDLFGFASGVALEHGRALRFGGPAGLAVNERAVGGVEGSCVNTDAQVDAVPGVTSSEAGVKPRMDSTGQVVGLTTARSLTACPEDGR